ncbi:hypothetical protein SARC_16515, partial [Sphaeroforma arctica JP610]
MHNATAPDVQHWERVFGCEEEQYLGHLASTLSHLVTDINQEHSNKHRHLA